MSANLGVMIIMVSDSPWPRWVPVCMRCTLSYSADSDRGPSGLSENRG